MNFGSYINTCAVSMLSRNSNHSHSHHNHESGRSVSYGTYKREATELEKKISEAVTDEERKQAIQNLWNAEGW